MAIIISGSLKKNANKHYRVSVIVDNDPNNEVAAVELEFLTEGSTNPAPNPSTMLLTKSKEQGSLKTFEYKKLEFEGGSPVGLTYSMKATMKDAGRNTIGVSETQDVVVSAGSGVTVSSMTLRQNASGTSFTFQATLSGDLSKAHHATVSLAPIDPDPNDRDFIIGSPASPATYTCDVTKLTSKIKILGNDNVTFEDSTKVAYYTYQAHLILFDSSNAIVDELIDDIEAEE